MNYPNIDKKEWGPGPWTDEPDRIEWEHLGFACLMNRAPLGNWCGYVAVPPGHPLHGVSYHDCTEKTACVKFRENHYCDHSPDSLLEAHGGLTYSDHCQGPICHVPKAGEPDDVWWFGFDCAHYMDLVPAFEPLLRKVGHPNPDFMTARSTYRAVPYVKEQIEALAKQLSLITKPNTKDLPQTQ